MRKGLVVLLVAGLTVLPAASASAGMHNGVTGLHVHFVPTGAYAGSRTVKGYMYNGTARSCKSKQLKVVAFGTTTKPTTNGYGVFTTTFKVYGSAGKKAVYVRCGSDSVYKGYFWVYSGGMANTGVPVLRTLGVGLVLIVIGWVMLLVARSERLVILAAVRGSSGGRAGGSDTAATRRR